MNSSFLQQYWTRQEHQQPLPLHSLSISSNVATIDKEFNQITNPSDAFSSEFSLETNSQSYSNNLLSSSTNVTIKEFCAIEKEDEEKYSFRRRLAACLCSSNYKTCSVAFIIGALMGAIAFSIILTIYLSDDLCINGNTAITFDDLTSGAIPHGYNNINWTNANAYTTATNTSGYYTGIVSGNKTSYNPFGNPMIMKSANSSLFTLYSAAAAAAWCNNLQLTVVGYNSNMIIVNNTFTLQIYTLTYLIFNGYSGLDTVQFSTSNGTSTTGGTCSGRQFAMDNICLTFT
ncbi:unnamed protein product [Rotaria sp. Silwood1]|nr:unnamed protein product [Rotaria sp. Silwood1]